MTLSACVWLYCVGIWMEMKPNDPHTYISLAPLDSAAFLLPQDKTKNLPSVTNMPTPFPFLNWGGGSHLHPYDQMRPNTWESLFQGISPSNHTSSSLNKIKEQDALSLSLFLVNDGHMIRAWQIIWSAIDSYRFNKSSPLVHALFRICIRIQNAHH